MIELKKKDDVDPICPHCEAQLKTVLFSELMGMPSNMPIQRLAVRAAVDRHGVRCTLMRVPI